MKRKQNRKGFTIVELVIVIAVIGILAAVLVPTFGNVIENANKSAAKQEAKNLYTSYVVEKADEGVYESTVYVKTGNYCVKVVDGSVDETLLTDYPTTFCYCKLENNVATWVKNNTCDAVQGKCGNGECAKHTPAQEGEGSN